MAKQTICLNMIVKNEAPVIRRCLDSVRPLIDAWVIVDTGSTDGTQDLIREALADVPGELHERPWVNFARNRTEALELARGRGDYLFVIDADEVLEVDDGFVMPELTHDVYSLLVRYGAYTYTRRQLLRDGKPWHYEGVLHEYVTSTEPVTEAGLPGLVTVPRHDGARSRDPLTYRRDALMLQQALLDDPNNTRNVFYLAQSYRDAGDLELALRYYGRRAAMKGWDDEVWYSLYQIAQIKERLGRPWSEVLEGYLAAYQFRPQRAGPLYRIAAHYRAAAEQHLAHLFLGRAMAIPEPPATALFVERPLYEYQIALEYAATAHHAGELKSAIETSNALLRNPRLPPHLVEEVIRNRRLSVAARTPKPATLRNPGRLRVVVTGRDAGPELDDLVESLLAQSDSSWEAVFVLEGDDRTRVPDDPRFAVHDAMPGADPDLIVLPLRASDRLASPMAITRLRSAFADPQCRLAYGQFRDRSGRHGHAEPAASEDDFRSRGAALAGGGAVAMRGVHTWEEAGFEGTRFLDDVLTIRGAAPAPRARTIASTELPKISCLMVTLDRLSLAKRAIDSYADQTWPNRELIIVTDGSARFKESLERHVAASAIENVRFVYPENAGQSLGALRNRSLEEARGEIVCQWDDDDCSHPDRLRVQCEDMLRRGARASLMTDHLQLIDDERVVCWVDWTLGGTVGTMRLAPGTLMMWSDARFRYPDARQGEDSVLLEQIHATVPVADLAGAGHLYLYCYHGKNTFSRAHHLHLTNFRTSASHLHANMDKLRRAMEYYPLARPVTVIGREGPVFAVR